MYKKTYNFNQPFQLKGLIFLTENLNKIYYQIKNKFFKKNEA